MSNNVNDLVTLNTQNVLQGAGNITLDGRDLGSFRGGVRFIVASTSLDVRSDYGLGIVKSEVGSYDITVETELEEATLENLASAWGLHSSSVVSAASSSSKTLDLTPLKNALEHQLVLKGMSAENNDLARVVTLDRVQRYGTTSVPFQRGVLTVVPVQFRALLNSSGSFGSIKEHGMGTLS